MSKRTAAQFSTGRVPRGDQFLAAGHEHPTGANYRLPAETTAVARLVGCGGPAAGGECRTAELANPLSGSCPPGRQFGGFAKSLRVRSESREDWDPAMEFGRRGLSPLQRRVPHPRTPIRKLWWQCIDRNESWPASVGFDIRCATALRFASIRSLTTTQSLN